VIGDVLHVHLKKWTDREEYLTNKSDIRDTTVVISFIQVFVKLQMLNELIICMLCKYLAERGSR
jgi:hypothetical protein